MSARTATLRRWSQCIAVALVSIACIHQALAASGNSAQSADERRELVFKFANELQEKKGVASAGLDFIEFAGEHGQEGIWSDLAGISEALGNNDVAQFIKIHVDAAEFIGSANKLKDEGTLYRGYVILREKAIEKAAGVVGEITKQAILAVAGGAAPTFPVLLAAYGAGYLAEKAVTSAIESLFAMIEKWIKELFADWNIDGELDSILGAAKKDMEQALNNRMRDLAADRARLKNASTLPSRLDSELKQGFSPTLGIALASGLQLAQHTWSILDQTQPVKGGPAIPSGGDITVYDIQICGAEAQNATGKAWAIRFGLRREFAAGSIRLSLQTTGTDYATGITPTMHIGVVNEYKVTEKWLLQNEGVRYQGFDRPPRPIRRQNP